MRQQRLLFASVLAIPLAISGYSMAKDEEASISAQPGIVLNDTKTSPGTVRLSKMIDTDVYDPQGTKVAKIKDVVVNSSRDQVDYIVLSQGKGLAGMGEKLVALPVKAIKFGSPAEDRLYVSLNKDILDKAPGFDSDKWPTQANSEYYRSIDTYYKTQLGAMTDQAKSDAQAAGAQVSPPAAPTEAQEKELSWSRRATQLEDRAVVSRSGENLGKITDIVLDQKTGKVLYAAFKDGGLHAIPLSAFQVDTMKKRLILDTTRDQLKETPSFDSDHWPATADPRWSKPAAS